MCSATRRTEIEYELLRGGLGGFAEHQRIFTGLSYQWTPWPFVKLSLDALRAFDTPPPTENKDRLRTMPNTHSVVGVSSEIDLGDLKAALKLGYTENIFPTVPFEGRKSIIPTSASINGTRSTSSWG
jgi:hypothetical protein